MAANETTLSYRWPQGSVVTRMDVRQQTNGRAVAYIYADESEESAPARQDLRAALRLKGWGTLSDHRDGAYALRVSGITQTDALLELVNHAPFTLGEPTVTSANAKPAQSFGDSLKTNSLRASGILYSIGNAIYLASGILRNRERGTSNQGQIRSALTWGAGDALMAIIGGTDESRQLTSLLGKLQEHYQREGIEIPKNASIYAETSTRGKSFGSKAYDFLHAHVNQIKCGSEAIAAYYYWHAGKEQGNFWKQVTAVIFGIGFSASGLIPERKIDPEKYAHASAFGKAWMKIQSQPLSIGGISGYSNTILTSYSAFDESRRFRDPVKFPTLPNKAGEIIPPSKYYKLDYAAPGVMFFGNSLYAMSKKTGGDIKAVDKVSDVYIVAAQILNKQPEELREKAIASTVDFLAQRIEIRDDRLQIDTRLREQMEVQRNSPWFEKRGLANYVLAPKKRGLREAADTAIDGAAVMPPATTVHMADALHTAPTPQLERA